MSCRTTRGWGDDMNVIVLRGIPGSSKTTWATAYVARETGKKTVVVSADDHFTVNGQYRFDPSKLGEAHGQCLLRYLAAISQNNVDTVIVDNQNTSIEEVAPYAALAIAFGHNLLIRTFVIRPEVAVQRNVHRVPPLQILMADERIRSVKLPPRWPHEVVFVA